jgi:hypothetical protein
MLFKYLFGGVPGMCIKDKDGQSGTYATVTMLMLTPMTDLVMHSDIKRWLTMVPLAGGFVNWIGKDLNFHGESVSCVVETFPRATEDATQLLKTGNVFINQYSGHPVYLICKPGWEPNLQRWIPVSKDAVIALLQSVQLRY